MKLLIEYTIRYRNIKDVLFQEETLLLKVLPRFEYLLPYLESNMQKYTRILKYIQ
jgi:hypothetical protein